MSVEQQVRTLISAGKQSEAISLVQDSASKGDDWSALCLAEWKLTGQGLPRDLGGAVKLLEAAGDRGYDAAAFRLVSLYATGTGCMEQPERARETVDRLKSLGGIVEAQATLLSEVAEKEGYPCEVLAKSPDILLFRNVLHPKECEWIRVNAQPMLQPSLVEEPGTGRRIPNPVRTSDGMSFGPLQEDLVINRINRRIARLSGTKYCWGEPLQILRYTAGQQYRPHFDALPGVSNQRQLTAILYCNDEYEGGETSFPVMDITVKGSAGDMLLFSNIEESSRSDRGSEHAGLPVTLGEKWIATRWIRQCRYHPWHS